MWLWGEEGWTGKLGVGLGGYWVKGRSGCGVKGEENMYGVKSGGELAWGGGSPHAHPPL